MKVLIHHFAKTTTCIYRIDNNCIIGSFFKEKPEVGTLILSHSRRTTNNLVLYEVLDVIENRDAIVANGCTHDPSMAYFELNVQIVNGDTRFADIDTSIMHNLR